MDSGDKTATKPAQEGSVVLGQKTPVHDVEDDLLIVHALAEKHERQAGQQNDQYARVVDRIVRNGRKRRPLAEREALSTSQTEHKKMIWKIHRDAWSVMQESEEDIEDMITEQKENIIETICGDGEVSQMQAETWSAGCMLCRAMDSGAVGPQKSRDRDHDWRACQRYEEEVGAVRMAVAGIEKERERWEHWPVPAGWTCGDCGSPRGACWLRSGGDRVFRRGVGECSLRGVMLECVGVILAIRPWRVREWEGRGGRPRGGEYQSDTEDADRFGYRAVGRVAQRFGWIGLFDIEAVRMGEVGDGYRRRLLLATGRAVE